MQLSYIANIHTNEELTDMPCIGYRVHKINESTFALEERTPLSQGLCYLLCGNERAMLIDAGAYKGFCLFPG